MLTTQQIVNRRTTYACCAMDYLNKFVQADIYGDTKCANENWDKAVLMYWAQEQMCNTPVLDGEHGCNTVEFATQVAAKADCFCKQCGCEPVSPTVPPVPADCTITPNYTVIAAVDVDQRLIIEADSPTTGDSYYVVTDSGGSGWTVNTVVTWNGGGWDAVTVQPSEVIQSTQTNAYWTPGTNNEPGLLFPPLIGYLVAFNNQYVIQSTYPWISNLLGRNVMVRGFVNGTWQIIYSGPESALAEPTTYDFQTLPITALQVVYLVGDCQYTAGATVIPPFGECGTITATITAERDCGTNEFFVIVDIEEADGYPLGDIVVTLNGSPLAPVAASLGVTLLGPYQTGDVVGVRITNAQDSECDFDAGTFTDPSYPVADITVNSAVDASFQGSAVPGETYLIVSDTTGAGNTWASHVGEVTNGFIFTPVLDGQVVEVQGVAGFDRYWRRVSGATVQMYPSVTLNNTQTFPNPWTVVSNNPTSATGRFRPTVVEVDFGGTWTPVWAGLEDSLATPQTLDFTSFGLVQPAGVRVTYYGTSCPITVEGDVVSEPVVLEFECGGPETILGSGDLYDIIITWNDGNYFVTSDDQNMRDDPQFADLNIGDIVGVDGEYVSTPAPGTLLYLSNGGGAYYIVGTNPGEIILSPYQGIGQVYMFTQQPEAVQTWQFNSSTPGSTVTIYFLQGTMESGNVIRVYDGTDSSGTPLGSGYFPSLIGNTYTSLSQSMFMEAESGNAPLDTQTPWIFIVSCTSGFAQPTAFATPIDDCAEYQFSIDVEFLDVGDSAGGVVNIQYVVGGVVNTVAGVGVGVTTIGPFAYDAQVQVYIRNLTDPSGDRWLGTITSSGACPAPPNPCLPDAVFKIDIVGDLSELPVPPPNPMISEIFFVLSDNTNIGTYVPGSILSWNMSTQDWEFLFVLPEGGFIYGPMTDVIGVVEGATVYGNGPNGPYLDFAPILVGINPNSTGVDDNIRIKIDTVENGFVTSDRPVKLQVFSEGEWVDVWFGTEQMLSQWVIIGVPFAFSLTRSIYNYDTCAVEAAYIIDVQQGLQTP